MRRVIVHYKVKPDRAAENEELVQKVFEELAQTSPSGLRYASFKQDDGVTFVHLASIETGGGENPLEDSPAFKAFQQNIGERCQEPPSVTQLNEIGSYRFFDG